jgi:hypothetical protein
VARDTELDWHERVTLDFEGLRGQCIRDWVGIEMALRENVGGRPVFQIDTVPFVQMRELTLCLDDGPFTIETWQHDDGFALCSRRSAPRLSWLEEMQREFGEACIYRRTELGGMPTRTVSRVELLPRALGNIDAILLAFDGGREVLLVAGEAHETMDGGLRFARADESVLVFRNPADAELLDWL